MSVNNGVTHLRARHADLHLIGHFLRHEITLHNRNTIRRNALGNALGQAVVCGTSGKNRDSRNSDQGTPHAAPPVDQLRFRNHFTHRAGPLAGRAHSIEDDQNGKNTLL
jgi:hypothetical protein